VHGDGECFGFGVFFVIAKTKPQTRNPIMLWPSASGL
jgi:hypothetical protein